MNYLKRFLLESGLYKFGKHLMLTLEQHLLWYRFEAKLKRRTPIIIYQMGKVASTTIYRAIKEVYPGVVLHTHTFNPTDRDWRVAKVYNHCIENNRPLDIISLTREPISRNISAFFQNFNRITGTRFSKSKYSFEELSELFLNEFDQYEPLNWFDNHIKNKFGIDVYGTPFPERGVAVYNSGNFRLLTLRSEINDSIKLSAIRIFLGIPDFKIRSKNNSSNKRYAETYNMFRKSIVLPASYIEEMCNSRYFNHFYSANFVEATRQYWCRD